MSNPEDLEIQDVEQDMTHALEMGRALEALSKDPNFIKVIMNGYLKEKASASVSLLAVPAIKARGQRPDIMEDLVAISNLQYFFYMIENDYEGAVNGEGEFPEDGEG